MKAVILAGGRGTRIASVNDLRPKPMVEVGGQPMLWHIMKLYAHFGITDFVICLGHRGMVIKEYFANYLLHSADVTFDLASGAVDFHHKRAEPWRVTLVDTGEDTMTGGRLKRVQRFLGEETFCLTYGDGLADLDIGATLAFHRAHGRAASLTAVRPPSRFGALTLEGDVVRAFAEKPVMEAGWINGGFFVLEPSVIDLIEGDTTVWEGAPLEALARAGQLRAFTHEGFWQPMDTPRERDRLDQLWSSGQAPWKLWS
jgi:glucose-1-phosphate cytidylyltransferase